MQLKGGLQLKGGSVGSGRRGGLGLEGGVKADLVCHAGKVRWCVLGKGL